MAYTTKTSRKKIFLTAAEIVERSGIEALSMREIARRLELAPNALYHHFKNRGELEAEIAAIGFRKLTRKCRKAVGKTTGHEAVIKSSLAFLEFARRHRELYKIMFKSHDLTPSLESAFAELRAFNEITYGWLKINRVIEEAQSAVFAMLHGIATLSSAGILEADLKLDVEVAISALLFGLHNSKAQL